MSGGVDSSVSAHLLQRQGHEVVGLFMKHGEQSAVCDVAPGPTINPSGSPKALKLPIVSERLDHKQGCCSASDAADARRVADLLDIPFYAVNFEKEFGRIMDYFVEEYTRGRTPNPCVMCNNWLKFGKLFDYADKIDAEFVATGHYARVSSEPRPALLRGVDLSKDQSYALFGVKRDYLSRMMLPVGNQDKASIRAMARQLGLRVADKKDSQEICFVTSGHHSDFVRARRSAAARSAAAMSDKDGEEIPPLTAPASEQTEGREGLVVTLDGAVVGRHRGIEAFTIGQRKGVGVAMGVPYYVVQICAETAKVTIGPKEALACNALTASDLNWLIDPPLGEFPCQAKIRYNSPPAEALAEVLPDERLQVRFREPRFGVSPGQAVVLYDSEKVLGGGWID